MKLMRWFLTALLLVSVGCVVGPNYKRPVAPGAPAWKESPPPGWKEAQPADGAIRGKWWEIYGDPQLNSLEEQVNISNQNVLAAEAQFRQAKTLVRVARSSLFPAITTAPSITASQSSTGSINSGFQGGGTRGFYSLPFDLAWQADLWGSIRRNITANAATAQASAADLGNVRLAFQAELALDYFQMRGLEGSRQLFESTVKSYREFLELTRNRYNAGIASQGDVAQAEAQLETAGAQLVDLGVQRAQLEHAIAVLIGKPPPELSLTVTPLQAAPPPVPAGIPSTLLERRPDIAAAERRVASANEQIGIAIAAFYPALTLGGSAGLQSTSITTLFRWPSHFWSVGPALAQTLFDAGRRRALVAGAQAAYDFTVADYRQTVLSAFQQVEDNLSALRILAEEAGVEARAVRAAGQSLNISTIQYKGGVVSYLQVITAQTVALQTQRAAVDILTRRLSASVLLIQALGGGWDTSQLPSRTSLVAGR